MKINWGNRIENAVLVLIAVLMTFFVMKSIYQPQLNKQQETIVELAKIARYAIQNDFKKVKAKDGTIILDLNSEMQVDCDSSRINKLVDTAKADKKVPFWKFWKRE